MQTTLSKELLHDLVAQAESNPGAKLSDAQRELISELDRCNFGSGEWRHEQLAIDNGTIDAFTIERDGKTFVAARTVATVQRNQKPRTVEQFVVGQVAESGLELELVINRNQIAKRICADVYARTLPGADLPDFAYPTS